MNRKGLILWHNEQAGLLEETDEGYVFRYNSTFLESQQPQAISITLPLQKNEFVSKTLFPFFDGLIPEGWLLDVASLSWKIDIRDRMGLLLTCCKDCIGAVSVIPITKE